MIEKRTFWASKCVVFSLLRPIFGESFIGGSTVFGLCSGEVQVQGDHYGAVYRRQSLRGHRLS